MNELLKLLIGTAILLLGIPLGNFLARQTKEELKDGQKWFKLIIIISLLGGFTGFLIGSDFIMFSFFFITVVALRSIKYSDKKVIQKNKSSKKRKSRR